MPRSIYQQDERTYIGHDIHQGVWDSVVPVFDQELDVRYRLNAEVDQVDYEIVQVDHKSATLEWRSHYDYREIHILLNTANRPEKSITVSSRVTRYTLTGLLADVEYEVNVIATVPWGSTSSNRQTFKTSVNPVPGPITGFRFTSRSNTSISLSWNSAQRAARYTVYRSVGTGSLTQVKSVSGTSATISLSQDTKYRFAVRAVNSDGQHGPQSAVIRSATGHEAVRRRGSVRRLVLPPTRWGSWRSDIGWNWWYTWPEKDANKSIYQGYWRYTNKRYWGVIEYDDDQLRRIIDRRFGNGTANNLRVTEASIRKVYRQRMAGNYSPLQLVWHLTNTKVRSGGKPSVYGKHVNDRNSSDARKAHQALGAGKSIDYLRIPRDWGKAIIMGKKGNTKVRGLVLQRGDNSWNGYGYAGYMKISGHNQPDYHLGGGGGRKSDLSLVISGNWDYVVRSAEGPYTW